MSIDAIRFRASEHGVILQVLECKESSYHYERAGEWRDAKVEDLLNVARFIRSPEEDLEKRISYLQESVSRLEATVLRNQVPERGETFEQYRG